MKLKHLEEALQQVRGFEDPSVELEQVITSPHLAGHMIHAAYQHDDITGLSIGDFGCGTGILSIASSLMGCIYSTGVDVDRGALNIAKENFLKLDIQNCDLVQCDIQSLSLSAAVDVIVTNPPFGTRNRGIDTLFVEKAMQNASVVYSLHKTTTRDYFIRKSSETGWKLEVLAELRYDLPKTHKFHKQKSKDIEVDLYRFTHIS